LNHTQPKFYNIEAEEGVIAGICANAGLIVDIMPILSPDAFTSGFMRYTYTLACQLVNNALDVNISVLAEKLDAGRDDSDSFTKLVIIMRNSPVSSDVVNMTKQFAARVAAHYDTRRLLAACEEVQKVCLSDTETIEKKLSDAQNILLNFQYDSAQNKIVNHKQMAAEWIDDVDKRFNSTNDLLGLSTGFTDVDEKTGGLQKGFLYILAARPSMGKSTLALNIMNHVGKQGFKVLNFSLEMTTSELAGKFCAQRTFTNSNVLDYPKKWGDGEWAKVSQFVADCKSYGIFIDDSSTQTAASIYSASRKLKHEEGLDLIVIDHLGLIDGEGKTETEKISMLSRQMKKMAKDLNCPVLVLSQLNRECDKRPDKRPVLSDLRQSGTIEQDANVVAFLYRDVVYNPDTDQPNLSELIFRKVRGGEIGTIPLATQLQFSRFSDTQEILNEYQPPKKGRRGFDQD